jgi:hypothetical protein
VALDLRDLLSVDREAVKLPAVQAMAGRDGSQYAGRVHTVAQLQMSKEVSGLCALWL